MLVGYSRFTGQLELASRHLGLGQVIESEVGTIERLATAHGLRIPDPSERRRLAYRSAIIEIYAALEDFVMEAAAAYAGALRHVVPKFTDLPECVRQNNLALTLRVLGQRDRKMWRGRIDVDEMLERLIACSRKPDAYQLNELVFREHTANFRADVVHSFFGRLDVDLNKVLDLADADRFVDAESPLSGIVVGVRGALDLLADRRNEVAHGCTDTDTLSYDLLVALLRSIGLYGAALHNALLDALARASNSAPSIFGRIERVFRRPTAGEGVIAGVTVSSNGLCVRADDWILCRRGDGAIHLVRTRSIELNGTPALEWVSGDGANSAGGIWVMRGVSEGWEVCVLPDSLRRALGL